MSLVSELRKSEHDPTAKMECLSCGNIPQRGGFFSGSTDILICSNCILHDDLYAFGVAVGDAILDFYKHQRCEARETFYPSRIVDDLLLRLEKTIYRTLTVGWFTRNRNKYGTGLGDEQT